ncbi:hypothetical protein BGZ73_001583 [Actinomortierella ambigua]|nr:hypothetical protein BGZ73_001583 [Actinomortierella ambigua]
MIDRSCIGAQCGEGYGDDNGDDTGGYDDSDDDFYDLENEIADMQPVLAKRSLPVDQQSNINAHPSTKNHIHSKKSSTTNLNHHHHHHHHRRTTIENEESKPRVFNEGRQLGQLPFNIPGFNPSDIKNIHSIEDIKAMLVDPPQLPVGIRVPNKTMSLSWLKKVMDDFHFQETRTDVLADLPTGFEKEKSIFTAIYSVYEHTDPEVPCNLLAYCPRGTIAVEKYGVWGLFCGFAFLLVLIFAVKNYVDKRQKARYRRRLIELDQRDPLEEGDDYYERQEKKRLDAIEKQNLEAALVTRAVFEEEQRRFGGSSLLLHEASLGAGLVAPGSAISTTIAGATNAATAANVTTTAGDAGGNMVASGPATAGDGQGFMMLAASRGVPGSTSVQSFVLTSAGVSAVGPNGSTVFGIGGGPSTMSLAPARTERSFDIRFEGLGLRLPTGVEIIKVAKTSGSIKVNGVEQTLTLWKKLIGFVPQEDVMLADLTVREILMHSAQMRQPVYMSHNAKRLKVLQVIQFLGLGHIMDSRIGDVETRGISGGERKRVNIGMELVASPSILFLDEPTSGLDSATSLEVCKLLRQIAREQALTVAAVVHSPSPHAFQQFDDLLLLGAGGRVVYFGPRDEASAYFERIGFPTPSDESPADFYIRLAAGRVDRNFYPQYGDEDEDEFDEEEGYEGDNYPRTMYGVHDNDNQPYCLHHHVHHSYASCRRQGQLRHSYHQNRQQQRYGEDDEPWRQRQQHPPKKASTPDERIRELFAEWENECRRRELAKSIEKHAVCESETLATVQLPRDETDSSSPPLSSASGMAAAPTRRGLMSTNRAMHVSPLPISQNRLVHQQHALEQLTQYPITRPSPGDIHTPTGFRGNRIVKTVRMDDQRGSQPPTSASLHPQSPFNEKDPDIDVSEVSHGGPGYFAFGQLATPPVAMTCVERDGSTMALHQPSRSPSPTFSVPISHLAGSSEMGDKDHRRLVSSCHGGMDGTRSGRDPYTLTSSPSSTSSSSGIESREPRCRYPPTRTPCPTSLSASSSSASSSSRMPRVLRRLRISLLTKYLNMVVWFKDVGQELMHWTWTIKCWFTGEKDPVRETPSMGTVFLLCFKRACLQIYQSPREFLSDQSLHLACGLCVSFAVKDNSYIPRQPAEICALAPVSIQLQCATPIDEIRYVGMFMCLGIFFAGISVGITTFGHEKACLYTGAFIFFFSYRQTLSSLLLIITLLYINAFAVGYCVSTLVSRSMFALVGTGMALAWSLVLSGTAPHLEKVMSAPNFKNVKWLWAISGPRWGVEAFYLKEMKSRDYNELAHNRLGDTYFFEEYDATIWNMMYISLGWHVLTIILIKLLDRHKAK